MVAMLLAAFLLGSGDNDSIVLSVAARPSVVTLSEPVTLVITLRNRSDKPRYVHRSVEQHMDFAVRAADGSLMRGFMHPPSMPVAAIDLRDWIRIEAGKALRCVAEMPLHHLGIERTGVFSVTGFWAGDSAKRPQIGSKSLASHFEHAEETYLTVVADRESPDGAPASQLPGRDLPKCSSAEAETRQPGQ